MPTAKRSRYRNELMGHSFVHTVIDDHSRVAYAEIHDDETAATAIAVLRRAIAWFAARGVTVKHVLSDNGSCYRAHAWRDACAELHVTPKRTRAYRPQTNGKIERFTAPWPPNGPSPATTPTNAPAAPPYRPGCTPTITVSLHSSIGKVPPITRLTNLPGQYN